MKANARGIAAALLAVVVAAVCVRLGLWQLDRLEQRRERNAAIGAAARLPTLLLDSASARLVADSPAAYSNRRVRVRGEYAPAREVVLRGRSREGQPGVHLVTPLRIAGSGTEVLVNRGWAPSPDGATVDRGAHAEPGPQEVVGLLQEVPATADRGQPAARPGGGDTTFRRLDLAAVRERSAGRVLPLYVQQLPETARTRPPYRVPPPELSEGSHLSYAVQWFSFAAIAVVGLLVVAVRSRRRDPGARP